MGHARPTAATRQCSRVTIKEERPSVVTSVAQSVPTHTCVTDRDIRKNDDDPCISTAHNGVVDELDDDLDAAMMDVDLEMFDDDLTNENQADHRECTSKSPVASVSNITTEMSLHRTSSVKTISDILTIVKEKYFHGTVRIKVT